MVKVDELDQMDETFDDVREVVENARTSTFETPYVVLDKMNSVQHQ